MSDYLIRFENMIRELDSMPCIEILSFNLFDPVDINVVRSIESLLGIALGSLVKDFYTKSNGLQLKWIHQSNPSFDSSKHCFEEGGFDYLQPLEWYESVDGCVNILPLEAIFLEQDWEDVVWFFEDQNSDLVFNNKEFNRLELKQTFKPFDIFSKSETMAFLIEDGIGDLKALLLQDHFAEIEYSRLTNFSSYLEFILHHWGLVDERENFYSEYNGHEMPLLLTPSDYWKDQPCPNLQLLYSQKN